MIRKSLLMKVFDAAYMQRWNDKIRPVELAELDKQAHKMFIAYFLGKFDEDTRGFSWTALIEGSIFELLQRLVITDLKPPIFYKIKADRAKYRELNDWIYRELEPIISPLGEAFCSRFRDYFRDDRTNLNRRILSAAHLYATKWEFGIIERMTPKGYEIASIKKGLEQKQDLYRDLAGMVQLRRHKKYRDFIDLCGQLRFQSRWANLYRIPRTSVIGHSFFVGFLSYLFSLEINACEKRCFNNYFTGLFHDLPEVLTRDIISPVKRSVEGLEMLIKEYEKEQMEKEIYRLIPKTWDREIRTFTENEFDSIVTLNKRQEKVTSDEISATYNRDAYNPRDGELVKASDSLAAFIEATAALRHGSPSQEFHEARLNFKQRYERTTIAGINFGEIYADFE